MKLLFVCNLGQNRSRTAAEIFSDDHETRYRGIYSNLVTKDDLEWADVVYVMEEHQRKEIGNKYPKEYMKKRIMCLDISDVYNYNNPELIRILKSKIKPQATF